jgi:2-oxoglutarate ferredoxin oxidoreductase subunit beta
MTIFKNFDNDFENKWCTGCGNFGILSSMKEALVNLDITPEKLLIVSGIGQASKTPHFLKCNMFHGLHGRALPVATGAKIANHELTILVNSGDGDCYGEGGNHFLHAIRRNIDITLLVHNNKVYGLTKGQASTTSDLGMVTKIQRHGVISEPFNPLAVALSLGSGFVARGFSGNKDQLSNLIQKGIKHNGFALIDILQPCVTFNHVNTHAWYKKRVYDIEDTNHVPDNFENAMGLCRKWGDEIPTGILFKKDKPAFTERIESLSKGPLVLQEYNPKRLEEAIQNLG